MCKCKPLHRTDSHTRRLACSQAREFGLSLLQWAMMLEKATALRTLVRIKVADDNDLQTAQAGLVLCNDFFEGLIRLAALRGTSEYEALQELSLSA